MADKVNVLLHGIFAYIFTPTSIEAYAPAVCGHMYKVSRSRSRNQTKELPGSDFALKGVQVGSSFQPDSKVSPVVPIEKGAIIDQFAKRFCKICLPYPTIFEGQGKPLWTMDAAQVGNIFNGRDASHLNQVQPFPSMHALCYERDNSGGLRFEMCDGSGEITLDDLSSDAPDGYTNLHIWCTMSSMSACDVMGFTPDGHLRRGFAAMVDLFPTLEVTIEFPDGFTPAPADQEPLPAGVCRCDVDPSRKGCLPAIPMIGHVNCHYANLLAVQP